MFALMAKIHQFNLLELLVIGSTLCLDFLSIDRIILYKFGG